VKWILRYVKDSIDRGLIFDRNKAATWNVAGFTDSDYTSDLDRRKSISEYIFTMCAGAISWKASLQPITALVATTEGVKEATRLRGFVTELGVLRGTTVLFSIVRVLFT